MAYSWIAVDALTGVPLADLPLFSIDAASIVLGQVQTAAGVYPLGQPGTPPDWLYSTLPWAVAILLLSDDAQDPIAGWYINQRPRDESDQMSIPLITGEGALNRRWTGDATYTATDQNVIATSLMSSFVVAPPLGTTGMYGFPFIPNVVGAAGTARDRTYKDQDNKTVLDNMTELSAVQGGPEFTVTWRHLSSPERYLPVFNVGTRIGSDVMPGLQPAAVFEMGGTSSGGTVVSFQLLEDYSAGKGANYVTATGQIGTDGTQPKQSAYTPDARRPAIEYRWTPSTSIGDLTTLAGHAQRALSVMKDGSRSLAMNAYALAGPRLGSDWMLGDTVGYSIGGTDAYGKQTVPAFPDGIQGTARAVGFTIRPDDSTPTVTPILAVV